ncbi:HAD family hydrolase [Nocardioides insulae]|uniref:HAD family hydrolase n=1 Tax=Nocardioides insulae TaxID=394734 RepID=UPI000407CA9B|nr:HAD family hydrolase [Nocardioides insulae]
MSALPDHAAPQRPGSPVRLVATDLDGTLLRSDGSVSAYTREALDALEDRGVPVVFVTGRPLRWARDVFEHVGSHGLAIVSNGAVVWDVAADRLELSRPIPGDVAGEVCSALRVAVPGSSFAVENPEGIALEPHFMERYRLPSEAPRGPIEELIGLGPVHKLLARHEELAPQEYWDRAEAAVGGRVTITWSSTGTLLEISAADVTKASTLAVVCERLGVRAEEVLAFGDMPNDLPMLTWAGTSYAMANAHPSVLACAQHVAPSHEEDGVAQVLAGVLEL